MRWSSFQVVAQNTNGSTCSTLSSRLGLEANGLKIMGVLHMAYSHVGMSCPRDFIHAAPRHVDIFAALKSLSSVWPSWCEDSQGNCEKTLRGAFVRTHTWSDADDDELTFVLLGSDQSKILALLRTVRVGNGGWLMAKTRSTDQSREDKSREKPTPHLQKKDYVTSVPNACTRFVGLSGGIALPAPEGSVSILKVPCIA